MDANAVRARADVIMAISLHQFLGVRLVDPQNPPAGIVLPVEAPALGPAERLHGGVVTALLDLACLLALLPLLGPDEHAVTHDLSASLIRPVLRGATVHLQGSVVRRGRSLVFLRAEARVADAVVATAQVTKTLVAAP
jgi:uncharacterized protein (TIGR00369 family)